MSINAAKRPPLQRTFSSEEPKEESAQSLLKTLLKKREAGYRGRGKYYPPTEPDTSGLPELPTGWVWASPDQLSNAAPYSLCIGPFGSNLKVSDYRETGTPLIFVRNIRAEDFSLASKFVSERKAVELAAHTAEGGDILITKMGDPPGDVALYPVNAPKAVITADCIKWRLAEDLSVPKFFIYAIRSAMVQRQIQSRTRGVAQKKISLERFRDLALPLPPLPEQRRIVAGIEQQFTRLDAGVAALRRTQANLKRYRAAVLKAACEGRLVPTEAELARENARVPGSIPTGDLDSPSQSRRAKAQGSTLSSSRHFETGDTLLSRILSIRRESWHGRRKYKEPTAIDSTNLSKLPDGWAWTSIEQLVFLDLGFAFKSTEFSSSGIKLLRGENMEPGKFRWTDTRYWPESKLAEFENLLIKEGEIVLAMDRPLISSGLKIARAKSDDLPCLLVQRMARFRPILSEMTPFLYYALNTDGFIKHLVGGQQGTQLPHISGDGIQSFHIALPPLAEQTRIVAEVERRLSVIDELESVVKANLQRAIRLRQSILQRAFACNPLGQV